MKNNQLTILKRFSLRNIFLKLSALVKKNQTDSSDITEITEESSKKEEFLQSISFKQDQEEKVLIDKVKNNPDILKDMDFGELQELNKAILNWKKYLTKRIEVVKDEMKMNPQ